MLLKIYPQHTETAAFADTPVMRRHSKVAESSNFASEIKQNL